MMPVNVLYSSHYLDTTVHHYTRGVARLHQRALDAIDHERSCMQPGGVASILARLITVNVM